MKETIITAHDKMMKILAAWCHQQWAHWMRHIFAKGGSFNDDGSFTISTEFVKRWQRQMDTGHGDLPDEEKGNDIRQAEKLLFLLTIPINEAWDRYFEPPYEE